MFLSFVIEILKFVFNELNENGFSDEKLSIEFNKSADSILNIIEFERLK